MHNVSEVRTRLKEVHLATATITSKGQVTIPKEIRTRLGVREGDRLVFAFDAQGTLVLRVESAQGLDALHGLLRHLAKDRPVSVRQMGEAVRRRAADKARRRRP
jgi:antitoxin PrlF